MKIDFEKAKQVLLKDRKTVKNLISKVEINPDCYVIRWKDKQKAYGEIEKGGITYLYFEDHDNIIKILIELSKKYPVELISAQSIANKLTKIHPDLKTDMLRPTKNYGKYYYVSLHLEHYMKRIVYLYKGEVFLDKPFFEKYGKGIPERPKIGLNKFLEK